MTDKLEVLRWEFETAMRVVVREFGSPAVSAICHEATKMHQSWFDIYDHAIKLGNELLLKRNMVTLEKNEYEEVLRDEEAFENV